MWLWSAVNLLSNTFWPISTIFNSITRARPVRVPAVLSWVKTTASSAFGVRCPCLSVVYTQSGRDSLESSCLWVMFPSVESTWDTCAEVLSDDSPLQGWSPAVTTKAAGITGYAIPFYPVGQGALASASRPQQQELNLSPQFCWSKAPLRGIASTQCQCKRGLVSDLDLPQGVPVGQTPCAMTGKVFVARSGAEPALQHFRSVP